MLTQTRTITGPGEPGYDEALQAFNLAVDQRPAAIARPADAGEVADVIHAARAFGLRVVPQRKGHGAAPPGSLEDTVLLETDALTAIEIDAETRRVRVGAGVMWQDVVPQPQSNSVTAIELVTADGRHRRVDHEHEPDLFWALRGGGGNCGVVTAIEFELYDPENLFRANHPITRRDPS